MKQTNKQKKLLLNDLEIPNMKLTALSLSARLLELHHPYSDYISSFHLTSAMKTGNFYLTNSAAEANFPASTVSPHNLSWARTGRSVEAKAADFIGNSARHRLS